MSRSILIRGAMLAALSLAAGAACADENSAPARGGLKVHMDPATGTMRDEAPATEEAQAGEAARNQRIEKTDFNKMTTSTNAHGAVLLNLNGQMRMYSVATVKPSGEIEESCITQDELARREDAKVDGKH
jgi:hypothetical protein